MKKARLLISCDEIPQTVRILRRSWLSCWDQTAGIGGAAWFVGKGNLVYLGLHGLEERESLFVSFLSVSVLVCSGLLAYGSICRKQPFCRSLLKSFAQLNIVP